MKTLAYLSLILALNSCSAGTYTYTNPITKSHLSISSRSVVTLIEPAVFSDAFGVPNALGYTDNCNAFCVRDVDAKYLVTAAHCVEGLSIGSRFNYLEPNGAGYGEATLEWVGVTGDRAIATFKDNSLVPLRVNAGYEPSGGDLAITFSSLYSQASSGHVIGELTNLWYDTNQTIDFGWSGSPVVNEDGDAWGIVSMCHPNDDESACEPNYAIISSIY